MARPCHGSGTRKDLVAADEERSTRLELVSLAGRGDPVAQEHLVALLRRRVRAVSLAILAHPEDAEDATQCILLEILASASGFRGGSLNAWADRIAVRVAARQARRRRIRAAAVPLDEERHGGGPLPSTSGLGQSLPRPLLEYLAELPEVRRTVLVLRHVLEYSIEEIAEVTEVSPNTVKDRLLHARRQVRQAVRRDHVARPANHQRSS